MDMCDTGWPSPLCGKASLCGDGFCNGDETFSNCGDDCADQVCGDGTCEVLTERGCEEDCFRLCEPPVVIMDAGVEKDAGNDANVSTKDAGADAKGREAEDASPMDPKALALSGGACRVSVRSDKKAFRFGVLMLPMLLLAWFWRRTYARQCT